MVDMSEVVLYRDPVSVEIGYRIEDGEWVGFATLDIELPDLVLSFKER